MDRQRKRREEPSFGQWQTARAALALLGVGGPLRFFSVGYLIWCGASEFGWGSWLAYGLGPASLLLGLILIPPRE